MTRSRAAPAKICTDRHQPRQRMQGHHTPSMGGAACPLRAPHAHSTSKLMVTVCDAASVAERRFQSQRPAGRQATLDSAKSWRTGPRQAALPAASLKLSAASSARSPSHFSWMCPRPRDFSKLPPPDLPGVSFGCNIILNFTGRPMGSSNAGDTSILSFDMSFLASITHTTLALVAVQSVQVNCGDVAAETGLRCD